MMATFSESAKAAQPGSDACAGRVQSEYGGMMPAVVSAIFIEARMGAVRDMLGRAGGPLPAAGGTAGSYEGIGLRMNADGELASIELCHRDSTMTVILTDWDTPEATVKLWHTWSRRLRLPMLLIQGECSTTLIRPAPPLAPGVMPRRYGSPTRLRRPRFLFRRRTGQRGEMPVLRNAREIICYE